MEPNSNRMPALETQYLNTQYFFQMCALIIYFIYFYVTQ